VNKLLIGDSAKTIREDIPDHSVDLVIVNTPLPDYRPWGPFDPKYNSAGKPLSNTICSLLSIFEDIGLEKNELRYLETLGSLVPEFRRILKKSGSLYLICQPGVASYARIMCDAVFDPSNMRNEIIWRHRRLLSHDARRTWGCTAYRILYYAASKDTSLVALHRPLSEIQQKTYNNIEPNTERRYRLISLLAPTSEIRKRFEFEFLGFHRKWRYSQEKMEQLLNEGRIVKTSSTSLPRLKGYLDEAKGQSIGDLWDDIPLLPRNIIGGNDFFRPTIPPQISLRILQASTNEGDTVLDVFCALSTTITEAQTLKRNWIGVDPDPLALPLTKHQLAARCSDRAASAFDVRPAVSSEEDARRLASSSPHMFECWALSRLTARPILRFYEPGVEGIIEVFDNPSSSRPTRILVHAKEFISDDSDVHRVLQYLEGDNVEAAVLVTFDELGKRLQREIRRAGTYKSPLGTTHPRVQCITVRHLLEGAQADLPDAPLFAERLAMNRQEGSGHVEPELW